MVVFPAAAAAISLACAFVVARDGLRRPRPDKIAWSVAFAVFAVAAGAEVAGSLAGWTPGLVRLYYLAGAVLVVGYLAVGELYLLAPGRVGTVAPGATLLLTTFGAAVVLGAPVDSARLADDGWQAIERGPVLVALAMSVNILGTLVIVGGTLVSAWRFRRTGLHRHRMVGCLLIAGGTVLVGAGGSLTRLGQREYLYVAMAAGVAVIFAGYLEARRPDAASAARAAAGSSPPAVGETANVGNAAGMTTGGRAPGGAVGRGALVPLPSIRSGGRRVHAGDGGDPAVAFLETRFLPLDDGALAQACGVWSVDRREVDRFTRDEARRVWALRLRLSPAGQAALDAQTVPAQLQLAELYHEVLASGVAELDDERRSPAQRG